MVYYNYLPNKKVHNVLENNSFASKKLIHFNAAYLLQIFLHCLFTFYNNDLLTTVIHN